MFTFQKLPGKRKGRFRNVLMTQIYLDENTKASQINKRVRLLKTGGEQNDDLISHTMVKVLPVN